MRGPALSCVPESYAVNVRPEENVPNQTSTLASTALLLACALAAEGQAQTIKFTEAYPGTKFDQPVYFGPFPGRANTNAVIEQHQANVLLVTKQPDGRVTKDTLYHMKVGQDLEQGLLGLAFHPDYNANHKYYISYTPSGSAYYDIVEERIADATGLKDGGTGRSLIKIDDPYVNHNGGNIAFGPKDGFLYYAVGDGGGLKDPQGNSQNVNSWLGKMHRIDVNSKDAGLEYHIPADNPFAQGGGRAEIYAYGLRNPWRWSFDAVTGDLWEGDVGEADSEEVNLIAKGGNYGWKAMEGSLGTNNGSMLLPIFTFDHAGIQVNPAGPAIIGGVVYRGDPASKYYGTYFMACYGTKRFWNLKRSASGTVAATALNATPTNLSSFGVDAQGRIYACGLNNGLVYFLDDPDLTPAVPVRAAGGFRNAAGKAFSARPGGRLDARAFAASARLEVFGLAGDRLGALHREDAALPRGLKAGIYLLKAPGGRNPPDLLLVR
jgi:glucose/arabinose dehydrogenase